MREPVSDEVFGHHFMMEWRFLGMLKYAVNKNSIKVVVFIRKTIFTTYGFCLNRLARSTYYTSVPIKGKNH